MTIDNHIIDPRVVSAVIEFYCYLLEHTESLIDIDKWTIEISLDMISKQIDNKPQYASIQNTYNRLNLYYVLFFSIHTFGSNDYRYSEY